MDITIIKPNNQKKIYGKLSDKGFTGIEPPLWGLILAGYLESQGYSVEIIDAEAENLSPEQTSILVEKSSPSLTIIVVSGTNPSASTMSMATVPQFVEALHKLKNPPLVALHGLHPSSLPQQSLDSTSADYVIVGEGFKPIDAIMQTGVKRQNPIIRTTEDIDLTKLGPLPYHLINLNRYRAHLCMSWTGERSIGIDHPPKGDNRSPYAVLYTSLGCPYSCLRGDTTVNTIYGDIPIKEIAKSYNTIPIYTMDKKGYPTIANAINIEKKGINKQLVRIHFSDNTFIDCTPDHEFKVFKWGNQNSEEREFVVEAGDLKEGNHVRALKFVVTNGYIEVHTKRRHRKRRGRLITEWLLGRKLKRSEYVHHKNKDKADDHINNLELCLTPKDHARNHPEISKRMRENNPTKNMTPEWRENIKKAVTGKKRSLGQRLKYRKSKLGTKNPNYKNGQRSGTKSRIPIVNHVVTKVEYLKETDDVYCLTVPGYDWFYANNVLVHNCSFCCINALFKSKKVRYRPIEHIIADLKYLYAKGVTNIKINDEMFAYKKPRVLEICNAIKETGFAHKLNMRAYARTDTVDKETLLAMRSAGIRWLGYGFESGSQKILDLSNKGPKILSTIHQAVNWTYQAGIHIDANYMFGMPGDTDQTMLETFKLMLDLNCEWVNINTTMAFPGSKAFNGALQNYTAYSQYTPNSTPIGGPQAVKWRDWAFNAYYTSPQYLNRIYRLFGSEACLQMEQLVKTKLERHDEGS